MVYTNTPSDRMQLIGLGELPAPGQCMVCGSGSFEGGYVNLGVWYEFEGNMMLCGDCVTQAGECYGMLTAGENDTLRELATSIETNNTFLTQQLEAANDRLKAYDSIFSGIDTSARIDSSVLGASVIPSSDEQPQLFSEDFGSGTPGEPTPAEPVKVRSGKTAKFSEFELLDGGSEVTDGGQVRL